MPGVAMLTMPLPVAFRHFLLNTRIFASNSLHSASKDRQVLRQTGQPRTRGRCARAMQAPTSLENRHLSQTVWPFEVANDSKTKTDLGGGRGICLGLHSPCSGSCRCRRNIPANRAGCECVDSRNYAGSLIPVLRSCPTGLCLGRAATSQGTRLQWPVPQPD